MGINTNYIPETFRIVHHTSVDFSRRHVQKPIHLVQYDKRIPVVMVNLYLNGEPFSFESEMDVKIRWSKKDRTFFYGDVLGSNEERNAIYFEVNEQMSFFNGETYPIVELSLPTPTLTYKAGSSPIYIIIDRNPIQVGDFESISEYSDLEKAKMDAEQALAKAEEAIEIANSSSAHLGETSTTAHRGDHGAAAYQHSLDPHAPYDAQKNSDITKAEIEAKLTGVIESHSHPDSGGTAKQIYFPEDLPDEEDRFVNLIFFDTN